MAEKCCACGKKIGGLTGYDEASSCEKDFMKKMNLWDESKEICTNCARAKIQNATAEYHTALEKEKNVLSSVSFALPFDKIQTFTSRHPEGWKVEIKGMVSGHSVVGTGPLTAFASAWTDFFGKESTAYLEKIRIGEKNAIISAKMQAFELGATDICDASLAVTEATSGNGMLMVSFVGTAIHVQGHECEEGKAYIDALENVRVAEKKLEEMHKIR